ncbi:MAG: SLC13 family permease [Planctomycetota bacterium]|nr:SLC13 family permease [Planctomycetota bacterium]
MFPPEFHPWIALATTIVIFLTLLCRRGTPLDVLFLTGLIVVTMSGVISPAQAFSGFSNPAVLTIGALLAIASGLRQCGVIDWLGEKLLGSAHSDQKGLARLCASLVVSSAFLLNTALVAMSVPMVLDWCRQRKISPSKVLIPVSYFAILGGVCTLIGTSTTLVVQAQLNQRYAIEQSKIGELRQELKSSPVDPASIQSEIARLEASAEQVKPMHLFEIGKVGLPCAIVGSLFLILVGSKLLPNREELIRKLGDHRREYLVEMLVTENCRLIDQTVESAGLRHLPGLFLIEIDRGDEIITPVGPLETIRANDRLIFTGVVETIVDLEKIPGLIPAADMAYELHPNKRMQRHLTEVVLSRSSRLIGQTVREANFRKLYSAAVVAVHRNGARLPNKIGDIELQSGDTLLLQTRNQFVDMYRNSRDFFLVSAVEGSEPRQHHKAPVAGFLLLMTVTWLAIGSLLGGGSTWANPPVVAFIAVLAMTFTKCMRFSDVRNSVDVQLLLTIACALGIGEAMRSSGAAQLLADSMTGIVTSPFLLLIVVYVLTMLLTEMVSNNAVAAIMIPIAISIAMASGSNPRPFIMAIALAASLAFVTPIGYQTNLMVMGPGGYRPIDYVRCGLPLSLTVATTAIILLKMVYSV